MDRIYEVNVGRVPNDEAIDIFIKSLIPEDLACLLRYAGDEREGVTVCRDHERMYCKLGKQNPSWIPGLTERDTEGRLFWRSYIESGKNLSFMMHCHQAQTPTNIAFAQKVDEAIARVRDAKPVWLDPEEY